MCFFSKADLGDIFRIDSVGVMSHSTEIAEVLSYNLSCAQHEDEFYYITQTTQLAESVFGATVFNGVNTSVTGFFDIIFTSTLHPTPNCRYVRLHVVDFEEQIGLRWEVYAGALDLLENR